MSEDDKYRGESGFVDDSVPFDESIDDTVFVPAYKSDAAPENKEASEPPQKTQVVIDVSDLSWSLLDEDSSPESYVGDAPLASPSDKDALPSDGSGRRSDFFDRVGGEAHEALFMPHQRQVVPQDASRIGRGHKIPAGLTVSELARQAEQTRISSSSSEPRVPGKFQAVQARVAEKRASSRPHQSPPDSSPRKYPKMLALLRAPQEVQLALPVTEPAPPVPGTFFPTKKKTNLVPDDGPPDVDGLLSAMADGLLVGEGPDGSSQIMVTLSDEFFRGTELRVAIDSSGVTALLLPPDYEVYRHLSSEIHRLEDRLRKRGLRVTKVTVQKP